MGKTLQQLPVLPRQKLIAINKIMSGASIKPRHQVFLERFMPENMSEDEKLPLNLFYPTNEMNDVLSEIVSSFPLDLIIKGTDNKNVNMLKTCLYEYSYLQKTLQEIYKETLVSVDAYVQVTPKMMRDNRQGFLFAFDLELLPSQYIWAEHDLLTKELKKVTFEEKKNYYDSKTNLSRNIIIRKVYTIEGTQVTYRDEGLGSLEGQPDVFIPNPYKDLNQLQVIEFKGMAYEDLPLASKLVNTQLELDIINTAVQNVIQANGNPIWAIEGSVRDMSGFTIGAGQVVTLMGQEKLKAITSDMQLNDIRQLIEFFVERIYNTAGLIPPSLKQKIYSTDSAKVAKNAQAELVGMIKTTLNFVQKGLDRLIEMALFINDKEYLDEKVEIPQEVLPVDWTTALNDFALEYNLGISDQIDFWNKFAPYKTEESKLRVTLGYQKRLAEGTVDPQENTNVSNTAKPTGTKKSNKSTNSEQRRAEGRSTQK